MLYFFGDITSMLNQLSNSQEYILSNNQGLTSISTPAIIIMFVTPKKDKAIQVVIVIVSIMIHFFFFMLIIGVLF
ncbi:MAG: hypothetical protein CSA21_00295 [Deltaproteobacteria bacterium]|nr:MAG: hypothetical protein CSA21_00295 [Deltaproteobacteria bacterium]